MTRRNDVQSRMAHAFMLRRLGYCLSGLGVVSSGLAYSQAIANAQTAISAPARDTSNSARSVQIFPAAPAPVAPPEIIIHPEIKPQPPALQVPAATVEAPPAAVIAPKAIVAPSPAVQPVAKTPIVDSRRAADLLPASAQPKPAIVQESTATAEQSATEVIITERPQPTAAAAKTAKSPQRQTSTKTAVQASINPKAKTTSQPGAATQDLRQRLPQVASQVPVVQANINAQSVMTKPRSNAVRIGPVNFSSAGVSLNEMAINPYFNPNLQLSQPVPNLDRVPIVFPIAIPAPITSLFGWRVHPITQTQRLHTGTDIGAPMGTPVMAALGGRVILADQMGGYGISVAIEHDNGIRQTLYAHLSEIFVRPGDIVQQGSVIGRVGSTGASTGPHLHFELRQMLPDGTWVAQDASRTLEVAMTRLIQSLQVAQQSAPTIATTPVKPTASSSQKPSN